MAVLLVLLPAALLWFVSADQSLLHVTDRLDGLLLALVPDLPGLLLAVLGVAVHLGLLGWSLLLQLTDLLGLKWQFCSFTVKGKLLDNFSQYLWKSVLHTSTWIFLGIL